MAPSVYDSVRMAAGYAFHRPAVHQPIIRAIRDHLPGPPSGVRALDVGCGAGLSTAALEPVAAWRVGLEPVPRMLAHRRSVASGSRFVIGCAEALPFASQSFDLVAAAGSLNYTRVDVFLGEASRVLTPRGVLLVYDFSAARRLRGDGRLDRWFSSFERRYPFPPDYDMDVRTANLAAAGLGLESYQQLEVGLRMTLESYLDYAMSETNVEVAVSGGTSEDDLRQWCESGLREVFGDAPGEVLFDAYAAVISRRRG